VGVRAVRRCPLVPRGGGTARCLDAAGHQGPCDPLSTTCLRVMAVPAHSGRPRVAAPNETRLRTLGALGICRGFLDMDPSMQDAVLWARGVARGCHGSE